MEIKMLIAEIEDTLETLNAKEAVEAQKQEALEGLEVDHSLSDEIESFLLHI